MHVIKSKTFYFMVCLDTAYFAETKLITESTADKCKN